MQELKDSDSLVEDDVSIMRIELKLKNRKKIKSVFQTSIWKELDDEKITGYYHCQIYTQLFDKFRRWIQLRNRELKKMIIDCRKKSTKSWHHILMQEIRNISELNDVSYILDIEQVSSAFKQLPDKNRNAGRSIKSLMNIHISQDVYKNHDIDKAYEIFDSLFLYYSQA